MYQYIHTGSTRSDEKCPEWQIVGKTELSPYPPWQANASIWSAYIDSAKCYKNLYNNNVRQLFEIYDIIIMMRMQSIIPAI